MKNIIFFNLFLSFNLLSSGCGIGGWWVDKAPNIGHVVPTTEMSDWVKSDSDADKRTRDWIACGGTSAGMVHFSEPKIGISRYHQSIQADKEYDAAQACMMRNGYHYIARCKGEMSRRYACRNKH